MGSQWFSQINNMSQTALSAPDPDETPQDWVNEVRIRAEENFDAHCIERQNPQLAAKILWRKAQGVSDHQICRDLGTKRDVIRRLAWRHKDTLETKKKEFSREYAMVAEEFKNILLQKADQLLDDPDQLQAISPDKLALTVAIMTDKSMALSGMAGVVVEYRKGASIDDAMKFREEVRARIAEKARTQAIEAEIISE